MSEATKDPVATGMTAPVIDGLELVEVDEQQRQRHSVPLRGLDLPIELFVERAVIAEAGERVAQRIGQGSLVTNLEIGLNGDERGDDSTHRDRGSGQGGDGTHDEGDNLVSDDIQSNSVGDRERGNRDKHTHQQATRERPRRGGHGFQVRACVFHRVSSAPRYRSVCG